MSGKSSRISVLWEGVDPRGRDVRYAAYFHHFNRGDYYEAHDVLESLWLEKGRKAESAAFYQGLIQLAGGFVHMRKHHEHPKHRVHGKRLNPGARLLKLAEKNIGPYGEEWEGLSIGPVLELARETVRKLEAEKFEKNPWNPKQKPRIELPKTQ
jgi:predicted metal-dependent hydrolase